MTNEKQLSLIPNDGGDILPPNTPSLLDFFAKSRRNEWLTGEALVVYVRSVERNIENRRMKCFDISNVIATQQGRGTFTAWLKYAEHQAKQFNHSAIYVENILNKRLMPFLALKGYKIEQRLNEWETLAPDSMYKVL